MMTHESARGLSAPSQAASEIGGAGQSAERRAGGSYFEWPRCAWVYGALLAILYAPVIWETSRLWFDNDAYGHGALILPLSAALVWLRRSEIARARPAPSAWGLLWLAAGLLSLSGCYLLRVGYWAIWSLVPVLFGAILIAHGKDLARIVAFPVCLLAFAGPMPEIITRGPQQWAQAVSTTGAATVMSTLGFPLAQHGNVIDLPQGTLEVADVCSGFRKLVSLAAFGLVYGYLYPIGLSRRMLLVIAAAPIAILANVVRIGGLIAAAAYGGVPVLRLLHAPAEIFVLALAFGLFVVVGRKLGCKAPRFSI